MTFRHIDQGDLYPGMGGLYHRNGWSAWPEYTSKLESNQVDAIKRAKKLNLHANPSTSLYLLIDALEEIKLKI